MNILLKRKYVTVLTVTYKFEIEVTLQFLLRKFSLMEILSRKHWVQLNCENIKINEETMIKIWFTLLCKESEMLWFGALQRIIKFKNIHPYSTSVKVLLITHRMFLEKLISF